MKILQILIIFIVFTYNSHGQDKLPIGFIKVNFDENTVISFYSDSLTSELAKTIHFYDDDQINSITIKNLNEHYEWLNPESLWLDYNIFILGVTNETTNSFQVVVNKDSRLQLWVKKQDFFEFMDWQDYLKQMFNIERKSTYPQKIYGQPNNNSQVIPYDGADCFKIRQFKGDWVEIYTPEYCENFTYWKTEIKSGWIQWKQNHKIIIDYYTTP